jgi:hypothetical protein
MIFPAVAKSRYRQRLMSQALASWPSGRAASWSQETRLQASAAMPVVVIN